MTGETFALGGMVRRQTRTSKFSHYESPCGSEARDMDALDTFVQELMSTNPPRQNARPDGLVMRVEVPPHLCQGFFSGVVNVTEETTLLPSFGVRKGGVEGELPFLSYLAAGSDKSPAGGVTIVFYHHDALTQEERTWRDEGSVEHEVTATWQVITVNARATQEPEPMPPQAMARNMAAALGIFPEGTGGTPCTYTAEEFVRSIHYWSRRAMCTGQQ